MEKEMRSYVVRISFDYDDVDVYDSCRFVTEYPVNSVGFWEDFYDVCFSTFGIYKCYCMRILEIEEGF